MISDAKAFVELGWEPRTDLDEKGCTRTVAWYREQFASEPVERAAATA